MQSYTIAIIDDDELFLDALTSALPEQHKVLRMTSSAELMTFLRESNESVDAFFIDLEMPDTADVVWQLGGLTAVKELRAHFGENAPMIGVLTGMDSIVHSYTCIKNGADEFIEKSVEIEKIVTTMQERLELRAA